MRLRPKRYKEKKDAANGFLFFRIWGGGFFSYKISLATKRTRYFDMELMVFEHLVEG